LRDAARRWRAATLFVTVLAAIASVIAIVAFSNAGSASRSVPADRQPVAQPPVAQAPPPVSSPEDAKAATCDVLRTQYPTVASAVNDVEQFNKLSWSDPNSIRTVNTLVATMSKLTSDLENSLVASTPEELRTAVLNYVAGLRAVTISQRDHASNEEINGTGLFYNRVLSAPLRICGIPG
jgi:hypothetical protein